MDNQQATFRLQKSIKTRRPKTTNKTRGRLKRGESIGWLIDCKALFPKKAYRPTEPPIFSFPRWPSAPLYTHEKIFLE